VIVNMNEFINQGIRYAVKLSNKTTLVRKHIILEVSSGLQIVRKHIKLVLVLWCLI